MVGSLRELKNYRPINAETVPTELDVFFQMDTNIAAPHLRHIAPSRVANADRPHHGGA
jgi:hypothetical protein